MRYPINLLVACLSGRRARPSSRLRRPAVRIGK